MIRNWDAGVSRCDKAKAMIDWNLEVTSGSFLDHKFPDHRLFFGQCGNVLGKESGQGRPMNDSIGCEIEEEIIRPHTFNHDPIQGSRDSATPNWTLIVQVPDLAHDIQQQNAVRVQIGWIAVDLGTGATP